MAIDLNTVIDVMRRSPLDSDAVREPMPPVACALGPWVRSRYTVRAKTADNRLVLWNTLRGSISVFPEKQAGVIAAHLRGGGPRGEPQGLLKYLVDRGFVVPEGQDEHRHFQLAFGRQHYRPDVLGLILVPSEDCNFRCTYCYEKFARGLMQSHVRESIKRFIGRRIEEHGVRHLTIGWFGGEPLYGWEALQDLSEAVVRMCSQAKVRYSSGISTNGYLLTSDVAEKLLGWNVRTFQITLDGPPAEHDCRRRGRDGSGTFGEILANLRALAARSDEFVVSVRVNYDTQNSPRMTEMFDILKAALGSDPRFMLRFHAVGRWGNENDASLPVYEGNSFQVAARLRAAAHERGLRVSTVRDELRLGSHVCYAARPNHFIIGASGAVMKCTVAMDADEMNVVGHLEDSGELKLDVDKLAKWTEPAHHRDAQCQRCFALPLCQGISCPLARLRDKRPCPPIRGNATRLLREAVTYRAASARAFEVQLPK